MAVLRGPSREDELRFAIDKIKTLADARLSSPAEASVICSSNRRR